MSSPDRAPWRDFTYAAIAAVVIIVALISAFGFPHSWLGSRIDQDFWPLDASRIMPNIMASMAIGLVLTMLYPPTRHAVERWVERHKNDLKNHKEVLETKASAERQAIDDKLSHIIKNHPSIPPMEDE